MKTRLTHRLGALALLALATLQLTTARAQNTAFTYQGRVTVNGTNFTGVGQFEFALQVVTNTSRQATALPNLIGNPPQSLGSVFSCGISDGGSGYVTAPAVTFTGGNPDATGTAVISNGSVTAINMTSYGGGYYQAVVTIAPPPDQYINFTIWNSDGTSGSQPQAAVSLGVTNGLFTVQVGNPALTNMTTIPESIFLNTNLLLQVWFNDGVHGWAALNPAQALTATPYANFAIAAGTLTGTLPTSQLSGSVPTSQLSGSVPASSLTGSVPAATLTSVPAAGLTGTLPLAVFPTNVALAGALNLDVNSTYGSNPGTVRSNALTFGTGPAGSGEGIASKRVGTSPYDLEFFTGFINRLTILASGNVGIGTTNPANLLVVGGSGSPAYCNGTTWVNGSDRNSKEAFAAINARTVLEKVSALPITEWKYKVEADDTRHVGPMAQDFHAAFGLNGGDDKHIATVDEEGVALAAIQGLNQKLEAENAALKARLEKLERLMTEKLGGDK